MMFTNTDAISKQVATVPAVRAPVKKRTKWWTFCRNKLVGSKASTRTPAQVWLDYELRPGSSRTPSELFKIAILSDRLDLLHACIQRLDVSALDGPQLLAKAIERKGDECVTMVKALLDAGIDASRPYCNRPNKLFQVAVQNVRSTEAVIELCDMLHAAGAQWTCNPTQTIGCDVSFATSYETVLHTAVQSGHNLRCIKYILSKAPCQINITTPDDCSVLDYVFDRNTLDWLDICTELLAVGAKQPLSNHHWRNEFSRRAIDLIGTYGMYRCLCKRMFMELMVAAGVIPLDNITQKEYMEIAAKHMTQWLLELLLISTSRSVFKQIINSSNNSSLHVIFSVPEIRAILTQISTNVTSLKHVCRLVIRQRLIQHTRGTSIIPTTFTLPLPPPLQQYVLLSDVRTCVIDSTLPHGCHLAVMCPKCAPEVAAKNLANNCCCHHSHTSDESSRRGTGT